MLAVNVDPTKGYASELGRPHPRRPTRPRKAFAKGGGFLKACFAMSSLFMRSPMLPRTPSATFGGSMGGVDCQWRGASGDLEGPDPASDQPRPKSAASASATTVTAGAVRRRSACLGR